MSVYVILGLMGQKDLKISRPLFVLHVVLGEPERTFSP